MPDGSAATSVDDFKKTRRAIMAGLMTSPSGLGNPVVAQPKLG